MTQVSEPVDKPVAHLIDMERGGAWHQIKYVARLLFRDRSGTIGMLLFLGFIITAIFAPVLAPFDPLEQNLRASKLPPGWYAEGTWEHPLGTDNLGRDILSRIIFGSRVSVYVGFFGVLIASSIGLVLGLVSGYMGGRVDNIIMGFVNLVLALPYLLFVVFIAAVLRDSGISPLILVILIFGITDSPVFARITRGEVLRMRRSGYVESAVSIGAKTRRILFDHIFPNLIGPLITLATFEMSAMIFYEAGLGFLGLSVPPTVPSWGNMLADGRKYLTSHAWISTWPGIAIMLTSLGMNLLGDWLRDVLDPKLRRVKK